MLIKLRLSRRAQHTIEYCALIAVVALGIILMRNYVYRSVFAHQKMWEDGVRDSLGPRLSGSAGCTITPGNWYLRQCPHNTPQGCYPTQRTISACECGTKYSHYLSPRQWYQLLSASSLLLPKYDPIPTIPNRLAFESTGFCLSCAEKVNDGDWVWVYIDWKAPDCGYPNWQHTNIFHYIEPKD